MSDSQDFIRKAQEQDIIIAMWFCGQPIDKREFIGDVYMLSQREGNA